MHRFIPALVLSAGYKIGEMPVEHRARHAGVSKVAGGKRAVRATVDLLGMLWFSRRQFKGRLCEDRSDFERMSPAPELDSLGIIAGNGRYPVLLAEAARARGVKRIAIVGFSGETAPEVEKLADDYDQLRVGQLGGLCNYFREQKITQAIMAGQIAPGNLFDLLPDLKGALLLARLKERNAEIDLRGHRG